MSDANRVVAHVLDGTVLKGTTRDFFPERPAFHLLLTGSDAQQLIKCDQLKALFFVKELAGHPERRDLPGFVRGAQETSMGKKVAVRFRDGEVLCGYTLAYNPQRSGFFLTPAEARSNNVRVFVFLHATQQVCVGPEADELVRRTPGFKAA